MDSDVYDSDVLDGFTGPKIISNMDSVLHMQINHQST
jgi:hypothetical protein